MSLARLTGSATIDGQWIDIDSLRVVNESIDGVIDEVWVNE